MDERTFRRTLDELAATASRNEKKELVSAVGDSAPAISFLSGTEFSDAGIGKKTVHTVAQDVFGEFKAAPTVSEALDEIAQTVPEDGGDELSAVRDDMEVLSELSGNEMEAHLRGMFEATA